MDVTISLDDAERVALIHVAQGLSGDEPEAMIVDPDSVLANLLVRFENAVTDEILKEVRS